MIDNVLDNVSELLLGNGIIIVIGCFIVGMFLKGSIKRFPNKYIPFTNAITAIVLGFAIPDTLPDKPIVSKIILLAFLGLSSVGLYEAICTAVKDRFSIDINKIYNNMINENDSSDQTCIGDVPVRKDVDIDIPVNDNSDIEE